MWSITFPMRFTSTVVVARVVARAPVGPAVVGWKAGDRCRSASVRCGEASRRGRRAVHLHATAGRLVERGGYPDTLDGWLAMPGIGPYTAAAIAAIAFGRRAAVGRIGVAALGIRLPDLDHRVVDRHAVAVEDTAFDADFLPARVRRHRHGAEDRTAGVDLERRAPEYHND